MHYIFGDSFLTIVYNKSIPYSDTLYPFNVLDYEIGNIKYKFYNLKYNTFKNTAEEMYQLFLECFNKTQRNFILYSSHDTMVFICSNTKINLLSNKTSHYIVTPNNYNIKFNNLNEMKFNLRSIHNTVYNVIQLPISSIPSMPSMSNNIIENMSITINNSSKMLYKYLYSKPSDNAIKKYLSVYLVLGPKFKWEKYKEFNERYIIKLKISEIISRLITELSLLIYNKKKGEIPTTDDEIKNGMLKDLCSMVSPSNMHLTEIIADYIFDVTIVDNLLTYF